MSNQTLVRVSFAFGIFVGNLLFYGLIRKEWGRGFAIGGMAAFFFILAMSCIGKP